MSRKFESYAIGNFNNGAGTYSKEMLDKFYDQYLPVNFEEISQERIIELDKAVEKYRYNFTNNINIFKNLLYSVAQKLVTSNDYYGPCTNTEKAYFFIKIVDPELKYLHMFSHHKDIYQFRTYSLKYYGIFDSKLLRLERDFFRKFVPTNTPSKKF